jgi:hypothetical protein
MEALKLVPQLFYDLIARVLPGSVAIIMVAAAANLKLGKLATDFWDGATAIQQSAIFLGFGFFVAAYIVGQLISPISDFIENRIVKRLFPAYFSVLKNALSSSSEYSPSVRSFLLRELGYKKETEASQITAGQSSKAVFVWYDWLRVNDPDSGARAAKIRAEYRMHSQNTVAFLIALVVHLALAYMQQSSLNPTLIIVLTIASLTSLWATARTYRTFQWAVVQQFYAVKASGVNAKRGEA